jgi:putative transposase
MPRRPRPHRPETVRHATARGVNRQDIFRCDLDRKYLLKVTRQAFEKHEIDLLSFNLMPNHLHYLVGVHGVPLSRAMHDALSTYAIYYNARYERTGHLFQNRFFDTEIHDLSYLVNATAYVHLNAVRAGIVRTIDDWQWSSHREFMAGGGANIRLDRLFSLTGMTPEQLRSSYIERVREHLSPVDLKGWSLHDIIQRAALSFGVEPGPVFEGKKGGYYTRAKQRAVSWALEQGFSHADIARELGTSRAAITLLSREC